jgi:quercetin dioxygenase-like cupin family protein
MLIKKKDEVEPVEGVSGILRKTMVYNEDAQICHFDMAQGSEIPMHEHPAAQLGYVISGSVEFMYETEDNTFVVVPGDSYLIPSNVPHGAHVLEDAEIIEVFSPTREEYKN